MRFFFLSIIIISGTTFPSSFLNQGYGDWPEEYTGYPSLRERRIHVLTNACRISPQEYRDMFLVPQNSEASDILQSGNYPSVAPLYWNTDLNRAARAHSEDMAQNHGLSHNSSDGTDAGTRISSYYSGSYNWGENIAAGRSSAFGTMEQWLLDITNYTTQTPAEDNSDYDGHRANIMNEDYTEIGAGYAYGPVAYNHFWTMDLGAGEPEFSSPITSGCHFFLTNDSIMFMATYTDPHGEGPLTSSVITAEGELPLSLLMGNSDNGTYFTGFSINETPVRYNFSFTDSEGSEWRYPETGDMKIVDNENSEDGYVDIYIKRHSGISKVNDNLPLYRIKTLSLDKITIIKKPDAALPADYKIINLKGRTLFQNVITDSRISADLFYVSLPSNLTEGIYILKMSDSTLRFNHY